MKFIIPILVGATIGYITNWIAIKMLFRPHYEKKIFNLHVPFTPGLIPKERNRIAKSIGEAVGVYLLSPDVVVKSLFSNKNDYINKWVEIYINRLKQEDRSLKAMMDSLKYENYNGLINIIKKKITDFICFGLRKDEFKQKLIHLVDEYIFENSKNEFYQLIIEKIELLFHELSTSEEAKLELKNAILGKINELTSDERLLSEIIPEDIVYTFKEIIYQNDENIANILRDTLNNPITELKLKRSITNIVSNNMNKLIAIFMSPEIISDKLYNLIKEYMDKPEINRNIVFIITTMIDNILDNKVGKIATEVSTNIDEGEMLNITNAIIRIITEEENQKKVINIIDKRIKLEKENIRDGIVGVMSKKLEIFLNSEILYNNIFLIIDDTINNIMNKPISSIVGNVDEGTVANITNLCNTIFKYFIQNKLPYIVQTFNISKVVEDEINSYDVAFAEEIILEIAHKELKAITWLGALLGGIMGMLSPLLQMI
ncbi:DUF445 family protein [Clostridium sp. Cult2]|uniref:DUF445 family protein n=1 Tax=Clostridium sp. Cult2 TaxID=2079003 RepID=UPI001F3343E8|nr:hypothetical protein [Clostridium sp. Cult2]